MSTSLRGSVKRLAFSSLFSVINFFGLSLLFAMSPSLIFSETLGRIIIEVGPLLVTIITAYFLLPLTNTLADTFEKKRELLALFLGVVIIFSPLLPLLGLLFYPIHDYCPPTCPNPIVSAVAVMLLKTVGLFWGLMDAGESPYFMFASTQFLFVALASLSWLIGFGGVIQWSFSRHKK